MCSSFAFAFFGGKVQTFFENENETNVCGMVLTCQTIGPCAFLILKHDWQVFFERTQEKIPDSHFLPLNHDSKKTCFCLKSPPCFVVTISFATVVTLLAHGLMLAKNVGMTTESNDNLLGETNFVCMWLPQKCATKFCVECEVMLPMILSIVCLLLKLCLKFCVIHTDCSAYKKKHCAWQECSWPCLFSMTMMNGGNDKIFYL